MNLHTITLLILLLSPGLSFDDYMRSRRETVLTHCISISFEESEPSPLYVLEGHAKKPKWKLRQGVGPPTLEMDKRSRTPHIIYANSLRQFGLALPPSAQSISEMLAQDEIASRVSLLETGDKGMVLDASLAAPLLTNGWSKVEQSILGGAISKGVIESSGEK
jgi:hypothetical protein